MSEFKGFDSQEVEKILLLGGYTHEWKFYGTIVIYDMFRGGEEEDIQMRVSGLDPVARRVAEDIRNVATAIRTVGGYDFKGKMEEKLRFVRSMHIPVREYWIREYERAVVEQTGKVKDTIESMGQ